MRNQIVPLFLTAVLLAVSLSYASEAAQTQSKRVTAGQNQQAAVVLTGTIGPGAYKQFLQRSSRPKAAYVVLDGPGGVLGQALLIGDEIRKRGLSTVIRQNGRCIAACAVVFLSGRTKYMGKDAGVGIIAATTRDGKVSPAGTAVLAAYLRSVGVPERAVRVMSVTPPSIIYWLTYPEKRALGIKFFEPNL